MKPVECQSCFLLKRQRNFFVFDENNIFYTCFSFSAKGQHFFLFFLKHSQKNANIELNNFQRFIVFVLHFYCVVFELVDQEVVIRGEYQEDQGRGHYVSLCSVWVTLRGRLKCVLNITFKFHKLPTFNRCSFKHLRKMFLYLT